MSLLYAPKTYPTYEREYDLIRQLISRERKGNVFVWQNLCQNIKAQGNLNQIRMWAKQFGVPPQYWNNPRQICALITPRVDDYLKKVYCSNDDEYTMDGDEVGGIPEYLKYTHVDPNNNRVYCYNILDLIKSFNTGQRMDPYRRFALTPELKQDLDERMQYLRQAIEPHGLGEGILTKIRDTALALIPGATVRNRLVQTWSKLRYPKYNIEEIMAADVPLLNGIFASLSRQEGIHVTGQEKDAFRMATTADVKRNKLVDTMYRIANIDDPSGTNLVAMEMAINDSTAQGTVRSRDDEIDELAIEGEVRGEPAPRTEFINVTFVPEAALTEIERIDNRTLHGSPLLDAYYENDYGADLNVLVDLVALGERIGVPTPNLARFVDDLREGRIQL